MRARLVKVSNNRKTGPIPVSTTSRESCPNSCPLYTGCYASGGPLRIHWDKVTSGENGDSWEDFCADVAKLPRGQLWRHNQAGDLPGEGEEIDAEALAKLVGANYGRRGFTYTHKLPHVNGNAAAIKDANDRGFTVNLSANNMKEADELANLGIGPVVVILPREAEDVTFTREGRTVIACPADKHDHVTCATCQMCQKVDRKSIIGFRAHGTFAKRAERIARGEVQDEHTV